MRCIRICVLVSVVLISNAVCAASPIDPRSFNLSEYKGKVVYLDFWASWCGPCKLSFPYMEDLKNRFGDQGLVIVADDLDQDRANAEAFLDRHGDDIHVLFDQKGILASRFKVSEMPTTVLIDRNGKVRYVHKGFFRKKEREYTSHVLELLNEH